MTPQQFFEQYPTAQKAWKVGDALFFFEYEIAARRYAEQTNQAVEPVGRESDNALKGEDLPVQTDKKSK